MDIKNINKKIMAGVLGGIILTTSLTLSACDSYPYVTEDDGSVKLNPDKMYSYNIVKNLKVISVKTKVSHVYLVNSFSRKYYDYGFDDVFTGKTIWSSYSNDVELVSAEIVEQYLIGYNLLKDKYSVEDLEGLLARIKQDSYSDINNKTLVKDNK